MREEGIVKELRQGSATIEVLPKKECTKCCSCSASKTQTMTVSGEKTQGLQVGDHVGIEVDQSVMMKAYGMLYALPLIAFIAAVCTVYFVSGSPLASLTAALAATAGTYFLIGRQMKGRRGFEPGIVAKKQ